MGTCIPPQILGDGGCLRERQSKIQHLNILTNGSCSRKGLHDGSDLSAFVGVKELSWKGLQKHEDVEAIVGCLHANRQWLEKIDIGLCLWSSRASRSSGYSHHFITSDLLNLQQSSHESLFPALLHLTLSLVSFRSIYESVPDIFGFSHLQSLKLRDCPGIFELIDNLISSHCTMRLRVLEIVVTVFDDDVDDIPPRLEKFLRSINDLEELYLMLNPFGEDDELYLIGNAIAAHQDTLRRLVYHLRSHDVDNESPRYALEEDSFITWNESYVDLLPCSKLQFVAGTFILESLVRSKRSRSS